MKAWLVALALALVACQKHDPPSPAPASAPTISNTEVQRAKDACAAYAQKVCACATKVPALAEDCKEAPGLRDAVTVTAGVAANSTSTPSDVAGALGELRATVKSCIEDMAQLPARGCP